MFTYPSLKKGIFLRRYKRFFVDIETPQGVITVHNPNTGAMRSLVGEGRPVLYSTSDNPKRKLAHTLELISVNGEWLVSNTLRVNQIVESCLYAGGLPMLRQSGEITREYRYRDSRLDFLIKETPKPLLVEVKSATYFSEECNFFPDAVTERGKKHLYTLLESIKDGYQPVMLYVCMARRAYFTGASHVDPAYCTALKEVASQGVKAYAVKCTYDESSNTASIEKKQIEVMLP